MTIRELRSNLEVRASAWSPKRTLVVSLLVLLGWTFWAFLFNAGQFGDNVEQFNWAQSLEAGYHKHPPLPSWVLGGLVRGLGHSIYWASLLAAVCLSLTAICTWLLTRELLGSVAASVAVLLWGLNMSFSQRAQLYNHNTVLIACLAVVAWCTMRATRLGASRPLFWWAAAGVGAAAAMLSKYQAVLPLGGLIIALMASGRLRTASAWCGIVFASIVTVALFTPHAIWVVRHDYTTLHYASEAVVEASLRERLGFLVAFLANQLRVWSPALLAYLLYTSWQRWKPQSPGSSLPTASTSSEMAAWMWGLVGTGLIALVVIALAFGVSLRNHWGVQTTQFLGVWLAWRWQRRQSIDLRRLTVVALFVQALMLLGYAAEHLDRSTILSGRRIDTMYPAKALAEAGERHWASNTACPLRYVAGTAFDAGLVSLYAGGKIQVFDSPEATPWIRGEELRRSGALYVLDAGSPMPPNVVAVKDNPLVGGVGAGRPAIVRFGILPPTEPCPR